MQKEELLKKAGEMARELGEFVRKGTAEPSLSFARQYGLLEGKLTGFLVALVGAGLIDEGEMQKICEIAEEARSGAPPIAPAPKTGSGQLSKGIMEFIEGLNLEGLGGEKPPQPGHEEDGGIDGVL